MKKVNRWFSPLRVGVAVFALAALALTGCDDGGSGASMATVTFDANSAIATGTVPAPRTVTRGTSITLPGQGELEKAGHGLYRWNTSADGTGTWHTAGSSFAVTDNITLFARWVAPLELTITVTGIPHGNIHGLDLMHPGTMYTVDSAFPSITGGSATFSLSAVPATYDIHLRFWNALYIVSSKSLAAGSHTIPFEDFNRAELTITVTGIPNRYIGGVYDNCQAIFCRFSSFFLFSKKRLYCAIFALCFSGSLP